MSQLTPSETAIVDEILSAQTVEELILLGQRLEYLHSFSETSLFFALALLIFLILFNLKLRKPTYFFQILLGGIMLTIPSIPTYIRGDIIHLPFFSIIGIIAIIGGVYHFTMELKKSLPSDDDEENN